MKEKKNPCEKCAYNAKLLHKDMPFGCFCSWCEGGEPTIDEEAKKRAQMEWIQNHKSWKNTPHIVWWYYEKSEERFKQFLEKYPDKDHAPNESWKSMYDILTLK